MGQADGRLRLMEKLEIVGRCSLSAPAIGGLKQSFVSTLTEFGGSLRAIVRSEAGRLNAEKLTNWTGKYRDQIKKAREVASETMQSLIGHISDLERDIEQFRNGISSLELEIKLASGELSELNRKQDLATSELSNAKDKRENLRLRRQKCAIKTKVAAVGGVLQGVMFIIGAFVAPPSMFLSGPAAIALFAAAKANDDEAESLDEKIVSLNERIADYGRKISSLNDDKRSAESKKRDLQDRMNKGEREKYSAMEAMKNAERFRSRLADALSLLNEIDDVVTPLVQQSQALLDSIHTSRNERLSEHWQRIFDSCEERLKQELNQAWNDYARIDRKYR